MAGATNSTSKRSLTGSDGDPRALAGTCIYSGHRFDPQYKALDRKTDPMVVPATYDHIFWTGNAAAAVWNEADYIANAMGLPRVTDHLTSYLDVYKYIEGADLTQESTIITVGLMLEAIWTLYASEKELNDLHKNGTESVLDKKIDLWTRTCVVTFRAHVVKLALSHRHIMRMTG